MKYLCVHCDKRFEHEGNKKPRCPECMRVHGIEKIGKDDAPERPKWLIPAIAAAAVAVIVGGYVIWARETPDTVSGEVPLRPLDLSEVRGYLRAKGAEAEDDLAAFLQPTDAIEDFAEQAVGDADSPQAKAEAVVEAIRERASAQAFVPWSMSKPRETPVRGPAHTLEKLEEDGGRAELYPLEVAALATVALREEGVDAMVADIYSFPGDRRPPDPSGHFGYYGVAVYPGEPGEGTPKIYDPYGGRGTEPEEDDYRVLNDVQVVGAALNHRAMHQLVNEQSSERAFELTQNALKLDRRSPAIRSARGAVLLVTGGNEEGEQEFEAAAQLRADAPRHNNLAGLALAKRDVDRAAREVAAALEEHPDYAAGHATLAAVHMAQSETDEAQRELERAEELDPALPTLPMLWANYYAQTGDTERAADKAMEAIEARPHDWQNRLGAARILRLAGRYDEMRRQAHRVLEDAPAGQEQAVRQLIEQMLGPTALEEPLDDEDLAEGDDGDLPEGDFQLGGDSALLGEGEGNLDLGGGEPSLGGESLGGGEGGGGPLLKLGDESTLRLREPGTKLRLDLGN